MWLIVYSNDHAPLTVRPIYSSSKLRTAQMMIFSLVAMIGLEKCCITSACLQWLCHSGERIVARGPLVLISRRWGASNEYPQHMFLFRNKKDTSIFRMKKAPYLLLCLLKYQKEERLGANEDKTNITWNHKSLINTLSNGCKAKETKIDYLWLLPGLHIHNDTRL